MLFLLFSCALSFFLLFLCRHFGVHWMYVMDLCCLLFTSLSLPCNNHNVLMLLLQAHRSLLFSVLICRFVKFEPRASSSCFLLSVCLLLISLFKEHETLFRMLWMRSNTSSCNVPRRMMINYNLWIDIIAVRIFWCHYDCYLKVSFRFFKFSLL